MRTYAFLLGALCATLPVTARAQDSGLHHLRAAAHLNFAMESTKLLNAAIGAKAFDATLSKALAEELKRAVADAKRSTDRASALLDEKQSKLEADFGKLREQIVRAEKQAEKVKTVLDEQTKGLEADEGDGGNPALVSKRGAEAEAGPDWALMRDEAAWLYYDVSETRALHAKLSRRLRPPALRAPKKPKKKR